MKNFDKPNVKNGRFCVNQDEPVGFFFSSISMMLKSVAIRIFKKRPDVQKFISDVSFISKDTKDPVITWIGHATFLIQLGGLNILTDPILDSATIFYKIFYRRIFRPGIPKEKLPNIDFVLISHNHMDHMDEGSLMFLKRHNETKFLVPVGNAAWFKRRGFERVYEYSWWENESFDINSKDILSSQSCGPEKHCQSGDDYKPNNYESNNYEQNQIKFTFLPASHWSQRGFFDKNKSLWGSWLIEYSYNNLCNNLCENIASKLENKVINNGANNLLARNKTSKIFFAGDTAYNTHFKEIAERHSDIDIALMPIGPCEPRKFISHHHVDAQESVLAFIDLGAKNFVPMHWGTFPLGAEMVDLPIKMLQESWSKFQTSGLLSGKVLNLAKVGQQLEFKSESQITKGHLEGKELGRQALDSDLNGVTQKSENQISENL